ncbi:MAG: methyltransferase type 12 [Desulfobacteraceae bacterium]|nr:methyltransferase type 12 [Desulfobacteraceae bacterium]
MGNGLQVRPIPRRHGLAFLKGFLRRPELVASVVPSSRFLERRLIAAALISQARLVVELGPGTGGTTRAMLEALPSASKLLAIEITPEFIPLLKAQGDPRLIVHPGSAEHIREALAVHGLSRPDVVISGIPFSTMPPDLGRRILAAVWACLPPGGHFIAYQFRDKVALLGRPLLGKPETDLELRNVPPVRIFHWRKPAPAGN